MKSYLLWPAQRAQLLEQQGGRLSRLTGALSLSDLVRDRTFVCLHYHLDAEGHLHACQNLPGEQAAADDAGGTGVPLGSTGAAGSSAVPPLRQQHGITDSNVQLGIMIRKGVGGTCPLRAQARRLRPLLGALLDDPPAPANLGQPQQLEHACAAPSAAAPAAAHVSGSPGVAEGGDQGWLPVLQSVSGATCDVAARVVGALVDALVGAEQRQQQRGGMEGTAGRVGGTQSGPGEGGGASSSGDTRVEDGGTACEWRAPPATPASQLRLGVFEQSGSSRWEPGPGAPGHAQHVAALLAGDVARAAGGDVAGEEGMDELPQETRDEAPVEQEELGGGSTDPGGSPGTISSAGSTSATGGMPASSGPTSQAGTPADAAGLARAKLAQGHSQLSFFTFSCRLELFCGAELWARLDRCARLRWDANGPRDKAHGLPSSWPSTLQSLPLHQRCVALLFPPPSPPCPLFAVRHAAISTLSSAGWSGICWAAFPPSTCAVCESSPPASRRPLEPHHCTPPWQQRC